MNLIQTAPIALLSLATAPLLAGGLEPAEQPDQAPENAEQIEQSRDTGLSISPFITASFHADSDFDNDIGEFGFNAYRAGVNIGKRVGDRGYFEATIGAGLLDYDITASATSMTDDAADIGAGLDDVYTGLINLSYRHRGEGKFSYLFGAGIVTAGEDGADFGDTLDFLGTAGFRYQYDDKLSLGLGVLVKTRLEDDVLVIPVPQIRYQIDERWVLESQRAGVALSYKHSDALTYGVSGEYIQETFRLNDTHSVLASEGVANHSRIPVSFFANYDPNENVEIVARIGASLAGNLEFLDSAGNDITDQDIDTAIFGSLSLSFKF